MKFYDNDGNLWEKCGRTFSREEFFEVAAALSEEDLLWSHDRNRPAAACFYPVDMTTDYIDCLETVGHGRIKANYEKLYRMAERI